MSVSACTATTDIRTLIDDEPSATAARTSPPNQTTTTQPAPVSSAPDTTTTNVPPSTTSTTNVPPSTTSTTNVPPSTHKHHDGAADHDTTTVPLDVFDPACVLRSEETTSMERLATGLDVEAGPVGLWAENGFVDATGTGDLVDICVNNGINDIDGSPRPVLDDAGMADALAANVERQQLKLNELFADFGTGDLDVDGVSGPRTGQRLCAARLAFGQETTIADMAPGTEEQTALLTATALPTPASTATESERWVLIDRTCQMMFIGSGDDTTFVFPTSTGSEGFENVRPESR